MPVPGYHQDEVVRITDEPPASEALCLAVGALPAGAHLLMPLPGEMVVQRRQGDIGEQRRENSALRRPGQSVFPVSEFGEDPGFEERFHQRAYPLILDPHPEAIHQSRMRDFIETGFDIALQYPLVIAGPGGEEVDLGNGVLRAPVRAEPVRARLEIRLEDGLEHQFQACLDHAVGDSGDVRFILLSFPGVSCGLGFDFTGSLMFFILIRPAWPECHKMATVRRVAAETQETPGK